MARGRKGPEDRGGRPRPRLGFTTKAAQEGGRGIGLALTQLVCRRRGGEVGVTNTPDGAMFTARMSVRHLTDEMTEGTR